MVTVVGNMAVYQVDIQYVDSAWDVRILCDGTTENHIMVPAKFGIREVINTIQRTIADVDWYKYQTEHRVW